MQNTQKDVAQHMDNNVFDVQKCIIMLASAEKVEEAREDFQTRDLGEGGTEDGCVFFLLKVFPFIKIKGFKRLLFPFKNE